ncbi:MAG TPA: squalene/phytoene synthase family protein [Gaiellaceae bacterium]|nr:squalene/phytoene synthase family protein [Gaiellaceae bacterium]
MTASAVLAKAQHENFPVALRILPRMLRRRLETIYGFARLVDDIGDEYTGDRNAALDNLEADLHRAFAGNAQHPLLRRITPFVRETGATEEPFMRLIEANRLDQRKARYETWDELAHYCTLSANPVGELVLLAIGQATPERIRWSDDVCTALQVAEHMQDVDEDRARGRDYLPDGDLVARGRGLLASGVPLVGSLRGWGKLAVAGYVGGGLAAFEALERGDRIASGRERLAQTLRVLRAAH